MINKIKEKPAAILGWLWLISGYIFHMWYQIVPGKWMVDADMASEIILADVLNKEHSLITTNWFYSSEIRFFSSQWIYRIWLLVFPNNWHLVRVFSAAVFLLIILAAFFFFSRSIKLEDYAVWMAGVLMWPLGRWYFIYVLYGHYYVVYIIVTLLSLGLLFRIVDEEKKSKFIIQLISLIALALLSGLNGIKQTFSFFAPLMLAYVIYFFFRLSTYEYETLKEAVIGERKDVTLFLYSLLAFLVNAAGYIINSLVLSKHYVYKGFNDMLIQGNNPYRLYDILREFFFPFANTSDVPLMSFSGIGTVCGIVLGLILTFSYARLIVNYKNLSRNEAITFLTIVSSLIINSIFYCVAGNYKGYYWLPVFPLSILTIFLSLKHEKISIKSVKKIILAIIVLLISVFGIVTVKDDIDKPLMSRSAVKNDYINLTNFLLENGYTQGYASFWSSNVLTEMSSGQIETWTIFNVDNNVVVYEFNQKKSHTTVEPSGPCFLIVNALHDGNPEDSWLIEFGDCEKVYDKDNLSAWIFESPQELKDAADKAYNTYYGQ